MNGNSVSKFGKRMSGVVMSTAALCEAKRWADDLMDMEFKGRGDREKTARGRLAKKVGLPESYLYRLQYKTREMKDVAGSVYRALMLAYDAACEGNEEAANRYKAARMRLRNPNEETEQEPVEASQGVGASAGGKDER